MTNPTAKKFTARANVAVIGWDANGACTTEPARIVRCGHIAGYWLVRFADGGKLCVHEDRMHVA